RTCSFAAPRNNSDSPQALLRCSRQWQGHRQLQATAMFLATQAATVVFEDARCNRQAKALFQLMPLPFRHFRGARMRSLRLRLTSGNGYLDDRLSIRFTNSNVDVCIDATGVDRIGEKLKHCLPQRAGSDAHQAVR